MTLSVATGLKESSLFSAKRDFMWSRSSGLMRMQVSESVSLKICRKMRSSSSGLLKLSLG